MSVLVMQRGRIPVVRVLSPRLDAATGAHVRRQVQSLRERIAQGLVLDLHQVDFVDSTGLTTLLFILKAMDGPQRLRLVGVQPGPADVLRVTRLDRVLRLHDSVPEALRALDQAVSSAAAG